MFAYPPSTRVERLDMQTLRQRKDFAQIFPLVMWIPTKSFAVGAHKFRKERLRVEQFWASGLSTYGTKGARAGVMNPVLQKFSTSKEEHGAKGNAMRVHRWLFREGDFTHALLRLFMLLPYYNFLNPLRTFIQDTFEYTRILRPPFASVTPILITHDARGDPTREATASRVTHGFLLGLQDRHSLFSYTEFRRFSVRFKMFSSEPHVCETTLWNTRYSFPSYFRFFPG